jgi:hypothetical protein
MKIVRNIALKEYCGVIYIVDSINNNIYDYIDVLSDIENPKVVGCWISGYPEIYDA